MLSSERQARSPAKMSPLSEKLDSDGTEEPIVINMSRARRDMCGKREGPRFFHQLRTPVQLGSSENVNSKKETTSSMTRATSFLADRPAFKDKLKSDHLVQIPLRLKP